MTIGHTYPLFPQVLFAGFVWSTATVKCALLAETYTFSATDQYLSDVVADEVTGAGYTAGGVTLASKTLTYDSSLRQLVPSAADPFWAALTVTARYAVFYSSTGLASTSPLISYMDFETARSMTAQPFKVSLSPAGITRVQAG